MNLALQAVMKYCHQPGCGAKTREKFCEKHKTQNCRTEPNKLLDETAKLYACSKWRHVSRLVREQNFQCQRLYAGVQCWDQSRLVHHLISPLDRPDLMYEISNLVCLCIKCHSGEAGTPNWIVNRDFVPTIFALPNLGGFAQ